MDVQDLYNKVSGFEQKLSPLSLEKSRCKNGCSRCCYTDISVFQIEADHIRLWFKDLGAEQRRLLKEHWSQGPTMTTNFSGEKAQSCAFLHQESCTIYEARPLICRTQGLAMKFTVDEENFVDICPLNEDMLEVIKENEILNLDLLNIILSQMESVQAGNRQRERIRLTDLRTELWNLL